MANPVPGYSQGTAYGVRGSYWSCRPDAYGNGIHTGCDYPAPTGTTVKAARGGVAHYCNHGSAFGNHQLEITPGDGTRDFYAHMTTRTVADGAKVSTGQAIGKVGAEGNVTGPHLHFERHTVATGGWSCSVVTNPAPSINYADSGGSGSGGKDDDMPLSEQDLQNIAGRVNRVLGDFNSKGEPRGGDTEGDNADVRLRQIENIVRNISDRVKSIEKKLS
jgi:murein DD-endopeptidase MepM/ murein hydrolase activator NlpD